MATGTYARDELSGFEGAESVEAAAEFGGVEFAFAEEPAKELFGGASLGNFKKARMPASRKTSRDAKARKPGRYIEALERAISEDCPYTEWRKAPAGSQRYERIAKD